MIADSGLARLETDRSKVGTEWLAGARIGWMTAFVLLHSPLVGPCTWGPVAVVLRDRGHKVLVPVLRNESGPYWEHHAETVRVVAGGFARGEPLVLGGHSAAGAFLPMAAERSGREVAGYVFVDAGLPGAPLRTPEKLAELRASGVDGGTIPPWGSDWPESLWSVLIPDEATRAAFRAELEPIPMALFEEPLPVPVGWPDALCAYVLFSEFYAPAAEEARRREWPVEVIEGRHLHMLVEPERVADALIRISETLRPQR